MTKKEKLYFEYLRLHNEALKLQGDEYTQVTEDDLKNEHLKQAATAFTVEKLEQMIADAHHSIALAKQRNAIDNWFKTPDGIRYRAAHTKRQEELIAERKELIQSVQKKVSKMVKTTLGEKWGVQRLSLGGSGQVAIGVIKKVHEDGYEECYFGCSFNIMFEAAEFSFNKKDEFTMSFASKGSFDPNEDAISKEYISGMGKFISNNYMLSELRTLLLDSGKKEFDLYCKIDHERNLLRTPEQFKMK